MSSPHPARRALPARPSGEHLRKQAKRLARTCQIPLAQAQQRLAVDYGYADWAALMVQVRAAAPERPNSPLVEAARKGELDTVKRLIAEGHPPDQGGDGGPLWETCVSTAPAETRLAVARVLLEAGADARRAVPGQRPLHAAAARGPVELVELLIRHGAIEWEPNEEGRSALDIARRSRARDKAAIVELLDRPVVRDGAFRAAIDAIHAGDLAALERLLDAQPRLLRERIEEPDCYRGSGRHQYFLDPKLFWFVANNPTLVETMPASTPELARAMIARGVPEADLDYALELVMTSSGARQDGLQIPLVKLLVESGATVEPSSLGGVLAYRETEIVEHLVRGGMRMTAPVAAALDRLDVLPDLLRTASRAEIDEALDLAVINNRTEAARLALEAGANPDRFASQHRHSQPLHQAALHDNLDLVAVLIAHGARTDVVDRLWGGTPAGWAWHAGHREVFAYLDARSRGDAASAPPA